LSRIVHVAVGVIVGEDGKIFIAKRPDQTHQGGLWEFPGGKVEQGETLVAALKRELREELAIEVVATQPLIKIRHDYGDKVVLLDVHWVTQFQGSPHGNEGQPVQWVAAKDLRDFAFPAANHPIVTAINLPQQMLITGDFISRSDFFARAEQAMQRGIRLLQLRPADAANLAPLLKDLVALCNSYSAQLQVNTSPELFDSCSRSIGLHLNSKNLLRCSARPVAQSVLLSASCHNQFEIAHAQTIGVDFICLSPVLPPRSHAVQSCLGWQEFETLVEHSTVPVFALGGMKASDLPKALDSGAQGIASISEWW
jgi:8-oxo-dGTP diphosphatase